MKTFRSAPLLIAVVLAFASLSTGCDAFRWLIDWKSGPEGYPTDISATKSTRTDGILLAWMAPEWSSSYRVYRAPDLWIHDSFDISAFELVGETDECEFLDTGVEPDVNYFYEVSALSPHGIEGGRDGSCWTYGSRRGAYGAAPIPYKAWASEGLWNEVAVTWHNGVPVNRTVVFRSESPDTPLAEALSLGSVKDYEVFHDLPDLEPGFEEKEAKRGVRYWYWTLSTILVDGAYVSSAPSLVASGYLWGGEISKPRDFQAQAQADGSVLLSWTKPDTCSTFVIRRSTNSDGSGSEPVYSPPLEGSYNLATSFVDVAPGTGSYWYWICNRSYTESGTVDTNEAVFGPVTVD